MIDGKSLSEMIRKKKKNQLRPDMDYAGQDAVDPNEAWDAKQAMEVNDAMGEEDPPEVTAEQMGENESSQDKAQLRKALGRLNKYFNELFLED
jgi:hypothetical protein